MRTRAIRRATLLGVVVAAAMPLSGCVPVTLPGGGEALAQTCLIGCDAPGRPILDLTGVRQDGAGTLIVRGGSTSDAKTRLTVYEIFVAGDWEEVLTTVGDGVGPHNEIDLDADITLRSEFAPWTRAAAGLKVRVSQGGLDIATGSQRVVTADRPTLAVDPTVDFVASVGSSEAKAVTIANRSAKQTLRVKGLTLGGAGAAAYAVSADACTGATLSPGASCTATVTFSPASAGLTGATLSIDSNDPRVREVSMWGSTPGATGPRVSVSPASLSLGELDTGVITVTNPDATPVTIGAATIAASATAVFTTTAPGDPARDCSAGATLPAAGSCDVGVFFSGAAPGAATGAVLTVPVTGGRPVTVAINGGVVAGSVATQRTRPARRAARGGPTQLAFSGRLRATNRPAGAPRTSAAGIDAPIRTTGSIRATATAPTGSAVPPALTRLLSSRFAGTGRLRTDGTRSTIDTVILTRPHAGGRICARLSISGTRKKGGGTLTVLGGTGPAAGLRATARFQIFSGDRAGGRITTRTVRRVPLPAACR